MKRAKTEPQRCHTQYSFRGIPICIKMYHFICNVGKARYKNLVRHFDNNGLLEYQHGNCGKVPNRNNVITADITEQVVCFIKNYAEQNGIG